VWVEYLEKVRSDSGNPLSTLMKWADAKERDQTSEKERIHILPSGLEFPPSCPIL
jgi:hypothetical protein